MSDIAIRVEKLSKLYHIGAAQPRHDTLRGVSFEVCPERSRRMLSVGDAAFPKKRLGKMGDVAKEGRTVLFVSHNMTTGREI